MLSLDTTELLVLPYGAPPSKGAGPMPGVSEGGLTELMPLKTEKPSLKEQRCTASSWVTTNMAERPIP